MKNYLVFITLVYNFSVFAQVFKKDTSDRTFSGSKINPYAQEFDSTGKIKISGYIDTYYSYYTDTVSKDGYAKFPTASPRNNQIGLNIIQVSAKYTSEKMHGTATLFYGDVPLSAWSDHLNFVQEANVGFRLWKKLWIDAGLFRTGFGLETIQARENITLSAAMANYFGPYFNGGAKLTWLESDKWTFQVNMFNGFSTFLETNKNKTIGASVAYTPGKWTHTLNTIVCDEYPSWEKRSHFRSYTNYVGVFKTDKVILGIEGNFGLQQNSRLADSTKTAYIFSGIVAFKYRFTHQIGAYVRAELYSDPDEILTGPVENENHTLVGLDLIGGTLGFEYKPIPNAFFRIESRALITEKSEKIFYYNNKSTNQRIEFIASIGLWF